MLDNVAKDVQKHYFDPSFHGMKWDATIEDTKQKIKSSNSLNLALAHIAQALISLNDSHTFFLPPQRPYIHDYGFQTEMVGDKCYVIRVRPGSDAEAKGLKPGDEVLAMGGHHPDREHLWMMDYRYNILRPEPTLPIVVCDPQGKQREVEVKAKFKELQNVRDLTGEEIWDVIREAETESHRARPRWGEAGDDVWVVKLPQFSFDQEHAETVISKARQRTGLIVDLRENPGGAIDSLKYLLGGVFDKEVKIADRVGRKESKPETAKPWHKGFAGKLVVLVDSRSASGSELFARVVQLEKRGVVVGDRSAGSVMEAKRYGHKLGIDVVIFYGAEVSEYGAIMSDGKSLEHVGVTPDELMLPTVADLAAGRDPVLSHAAALLGAKLTPEDAGKMFPYEWPKE
jgi:C-terminal processing protease CtpA/Prc